MYKIFQAVSLFATYLHAIYATMLIAIAVATPCKYGISLMPKSNNDSTEEIK